MSTEFLEIVLQHSDSDFAGRDEVEDPLHDALVKAGVGSVVGGGTGELSSNIDVELTDLAAGLEIVRTTLRHLGVARSTRLLHSSPRSGAEPPARTEYLVYDPVTAV